MELKEFIKTAITDNTCTVSELQNELKNGAIVSPSLPNSIPNATIIGPNNVKVNRRITQIDFDVANHEYNYGLAVTRNRKTAAT